MTTPIAKRRYSPELVAEVVVGAGQAVHQELVSLDADVDRACYLVPGDVAWDECDCGQLAQTVTEVVPSSSFPTPATDTRQTPCGPGLAMVRVRLSLVRCVPGMDDNGTPPACDDLAVAALALETDRWVVRRVVPCYLQELRRTYVILDYAVGAGTSVGPLGGCAGVELLYTFGVADACCD
jgi:hypothetical protein